MSADSFRVRKSRIVLKWVGVFLLSSAAVLGLLAGISLVIQLNQAATTCQPGDEPPVITLNGDELMTLVAGYDTYEEPGAVAVNACGEVDVEISGEVDVNTPGTYRIYYKVEDENHNIITKRRKITILPYNGTIYLTFDDGPGDDTGRLLDILAKYNVKATFFVTGRGDDVLITREYSEGHAVGLHTLSHNYAYIYRNAENFWSDLVAAQERVSNATGGYVSWLMRFPGGSSNTVSRRYDGGARIMSALAIQAAERGFSYFDWNVDSDDAGSATSADEVYENVVSGLKVGGESVVLQHDIKSFSVDAVERIIQYGVQNGFVFKKLTTDSYDAHHGVNN